MPIGNNAKSCTGDLPLCHMSGMLPHAAQMYDEIMMHNIYNGRFFLFCQMRRAVTHKTRPKESCAVPRTMSAAPKRGSTWDEGDTQGKRQHTLRAQRLSPHTPSHTTCANGTVAPTESL